MSSNNDNQTDMPVCKACATTAENIRRRSVTIRKIASMFEDAPPVRVHGDKSQTYGPYTSNT